MTHLSPDKLFNLVNVLASWNPMAEVGMNDEQRTQLVLDETADEPETRRLYINLLSDLLGDPDIDLADREELIGKGAERIVGEPGDLSAWLQAQLDRLITARPVERTVADDGPIPSLVELNELWWQLKKLRAEAGSPRSVEEEAERAVEAFGERSGAFVDLLSRFSGSCLSDRDKADYIVSAVGPRFYSDIEAIEWSAAVALTVRNLQSG